MKKRTMATMTIAAACMCATIALTGCSWSDFTEKFVGVSAEAVASGESADVELPAYVSGQAVELEAYDATQLVTLAQYKGVEIDCKVSDEEVQEEVDSLLDSHPKKVKTGTAENGMSVNIDYTGKLDGKKFDGGSAKGTTIKLGESGMIPGFDDGIIGMKVGEEKDVELTFPDEYPNDPDMAGKKTVFTMKLNYIEEKPELTDEFIKKNTDFDTVQAFKDAKKKELTEAKESEVQAKALEQVVGNSSVSSVPPTLLLAEKELTRFQMEQQMAMYGMTLEDAIAQYGMTDEQFEEYLMTNAKNLAESELIMEAIAIKENIDLSQAAIDKYIQELLEKSSVDESGTKMTLDQLKENFAQYYGPAMPFEHYMRSSLIYTKVSELVGKEAKAIK